MDVLYKTPDIPSFVKTEKGIPGCITGLRLQPLVNFNTGIIEAHEVLSSLLPGLNPEIFFSKLGAAEVMSLFCWQVSFVLRRKGVFWLNLPVSVLTNSMLLRYVLDINPQDRLVIELQDPDSLNALDLLQIEALQRNLSALRRAGWRIWLDDIHQSLLDTALLFIEHFDGVKVSVKTFHSLLLGPKDHYESFIELLHCHFPRILIEGIETDEQRREAKAIGVDLGQGYLWPEQRVALNVNAHFIAQSSLLRKRLLAQQDATITCYAPMQDNYLVYGLLHALQQNLSSSFDGEMQIVRRVSTESEARLILRECWPWDGPFNRDRYVQNELYRNFVDQRVYIPIYSSTPSTHAGLAINRRDSINDINAIFATYFRFGRFMSAARIKELNRRYISEPGMTSLSVSEDRVIRLLCSGFNTQRAADIMKCSVKSISRNKSSAMKKLGLVTHKDLYRYIDWRNCYRND